MIPVPQGAKTSDVSPDYATDRLIISPDKLLFMFITPDESIHKSLHVTYSVIQNKKKQQKKNKSPDVNLSDLKLFIYINLRITKPLKRRFLRTLSFLFFFQQTHYNQCFHLTCQPVSSGWKVIPVFSAAAEEFYVSSTGSGSSAMLCYVGIFRWGAATDCLSSFLVSLDLPFMFLLLFALLFMLKTAFVLQGLTHFSPFTICHEHHASLLCITPLYLE